MNSIFNSIPSCKSELDLFATYPTNVQILENEIIEILHRIHECALDFFEHDDAEEKERGGDCSRDSEALPWDCAAEEDGAETLNDGSHGVEIHEEGVFFRNHAPSTFIAILNYL